jgi:hypothetical protein
MGPLIDKLFALFVMLPPVYMLFRFVRWWMRQDEKPEQDSAEALGE